MTPANKNAPVNRKTFFFDQGDTLLAFRSDHENVYVYVTNKAGDLLYGEYTVPVENFEQVAGELT